MKAKALYYSKCEGSPEAILSDQGLFQRTVVPTCPPGLAVDIPPLVLHQRGYDNGLKLADVELLVHHSPRVKVYLFMWTWSVTRNEVEDKGVFM